MESSVEAASLAPLEETSSEEQAKEETSTDTGNDQTTGAEVVENLLGLFDFAKEPAAVDADAPIDIGDGPVAEDPEQRSIAKDESVFGIFRSPSSGAGITNKAQAGGGEVEDPEAHDERAV